MRTQSEGRAQSGVGALSVLKTCGSEAELGARCAWPSPPVPGEQGPVLQTGSPGLWAQHEVAGELRPGGVQHSDNVPARNKAGSREGPL